MEGLNTTKLTVCVYCGSSPGVNPIYQRAAIDLGQELAKEGMNLIYGGGSLGLMGLVAKAAAEGGAQVTGVLPKSLQSAIGETIGEVRVVSGMHQRKTLMAKTADIFVALPGGYGTLEELAEIITWAQLGLHHKPVGLLNVNGYYDLLLAFVKRATREGFVMPMHRRLLITGRSAKELLLRLGEARTMHEVTALRLGRERVTTSTESHAFIDLKAKIILAISEVENVEALVEVMNNYLGYARLYEAYEKMQQRHAQTALTLIEGTVNLNEPAQAQGRDPMQGSAEEAFTGRPPKIPVKKRSRRKEASSSQQETP